MKRIILVLLGVLLAGVAAEGYLRLFRPQLTYERLPQVKSGCFRPNPTFFAEHKPNAMCRFVTPEFDVTVPTNNMGFNGTRKTEKEKKEGVKRIVFVGDSFTFGEGVGTDENYPAATERLLTQNGMQVEVVNAGMAGVGIDWYYLTLKEKLLALSPDFVVVGVHIGTDLTDDFVYFKTPEADANGLPTRMTSSLQYVDSDGSRRYTTTPMRYRIPILRSLHSFIYISTLLSGPYTPSSERELTGTPCLISPGCHDLDENFTRAAKLIAAMDALARQNGARLVVVLIPWEYQLPRNLLSRLQLGIYVDSTRRHYPSDRLRSLLEERGVATFDLLPAFEAYNGNEELIYPYDRHWTPAGHRVAANVIAPVLEKILTGDAESPSAETEVSP